MSNVTVKEDNGNVTVSEANTGSFMNPESGWIKCGPHWEHRPSSGYGEDDSASFCVGLMVGLVTGLLIGVIAAVIVL
jgi:hypothetical protein